MVGTVVVTGANGQLGKELMKRLKELKIHCIGVDREEFDLTDAFKTMESVKKLQPEIIVHCAAYTAVDQAEQEPELCWAVNVEGTKNIADACAATGAKLLYISTDYIFPGTGEIPYENKDQPDPESVYGKTKLAGEEAVKERLENYFIVRISWIYGVYGKNFVKTMLRLSNDREELQVVADQIGSPTYTKDLAVLLCEMLQTEKYGIYHATNEGFCSWADFAEEIFHQADRTTRVKRVTTKEYGAAAKRPCNSRLSKQSLEDAGFQRLPHWKDALRRYLKEELEAETIKD